VQDGSWEERGTLGSMLVHHGEPRTSFWPLAKNIPELVRTSLTSEAPVSALTTPDLRMLGLASAIRYSTSAAQQGASVTPPRACHSCLDGQRQLHTVGEELAEQEDSWVPRQHLHPVLFGPMVNFSQPPCDTDAVMWAWGMQPQSKCTKQTDEMFFGVLALGMAC
jgi:hypothetical protein